MNIKQQIIIQKPNPNQIKDCLTWSTWGCSISKFPWTYSDTETAYIIKGKVIITPTNGNPIEINQGDLCIFPEGMSCTWDVKEELFKHYKFD